MSPKISRAGQPLSDVLVYLTASEARDLQIALQRHFEGQPGYHGPAWHCHIEDSNGTERTLGVLDDD